MDQQDEAHMEAIQEEESPQFSFGQKAAVFLPAAAVVCGADALLHAPLPIAIAGMVGAFALAKTSPQLYSELRKHAPLPELSPRRERTPGEWTLSERMLGRHYGQEQKPHVQQEPEAEEEVVAPGGTEETLSRSEDDLVFGQVVAQEGPRVPRLTISQIVQHIEPNSYKIYIGRSLTKPGNPAVGINFYKRHIKIIGASQYGKSSMTAALLEIITRTHDPEHVLVALLDLEDQTSKLFARIAHRAMIQRDGKTVVLHARSYEQVLEHLGHLIWIMEYRYTLSKTEVQDVPIILVYLEEFIALKDFFKSRIDASPSKEEKDEAKKDYADLVYRIKEIARRGLKVKVQLLMCAQVDYRDEDLQEALINVTSGMSFCVRVTAAQAAGFYNAELLKRNVLADQKGQAVVEMPDCKDIVLAPEYDLERRLIALEKAEAKQGGQVTQRSRRDSVVAAANTLQQQETAPAPAARERFVAESEMQVQENGTRRLYAIPRSEEMEELQPNPEKGPTMLAALEANEQEDLEQELPRKRRYEREEEIDLDEAIKAWFEEGFDSEDKLMRRFPGLTKYQAGKLRDRIDPKNRAKDIVRQQLNG